MSLSTKLALCLALAIPLTLAAAIPPAQDLSATVSLASLSGQSNTVPLQPGLPDPASQGLAFKYVALGHGTQNYTCASAGATPVSVGAVADLYDALYLSYAANKALLETVTKTSLSTHSGLGLPHLGKHFFIGPTTPFFYLDATHPPAKLQAKKITNVPAPSSAVKGSVDWLYLFDDGKGGSTGLRAVYRVETAGGTGTCTKAGHVEFEYAALYWFYE